MEFPVGKIGVDIAGGCKPRVKISITHLNANEKAYLKKKMEKKVLPCPDVKILGLEYGLSTVKGEPKKGKEIKVRLSNTIQNCPLPNLRHKISVQKQQSC